MDEVNFETSGSSGAPKPIARDAAQLAADARGIVAEFPELWAGRPRVVATVPADHLYGALWRVRAPAAAGCPVFENTVLSVEELLAAAGRHAPVVLVTTPSFLEVALEHDDFAGLRGSVKAVVTSGSWLKASVAAKVRETLGVSPLEIYGSTEAGSVAYRRQADSAVWKTFAAVKVESGDEGRLVVRSPLALADPWPMADAAKVLDPRSFELRGRLDRRVKILEKFVSLPEVEAAICRSPLAAAARVEPYAAGVTRLGALVVPSAAAIAQMRSESLSAVANRLREELKTRLPAAAIPRRIRFVRTLPVNDRGKVSAQAAQAALKTWCREPVVLSWRASAAELQARLWFPAEMECFKGHFPGFPVLPGVAQMDMTVRFARQVFPDFPQTLTFGKLKFQKIIRPGDEVALTVTRKDGGSFAFSLALDRGQCTSGTISESQR